MKVSLNTIKQYTDIDLSVDELVAKINAQLGGVEEVIDLATRYKDATIVKVVKCEKHPDADKLSVCEIDAGTGENIQVVCGAPNVHADMLAVWLPPKSTVPASFDEKEPFVLEARDLRGIMSNGMLASPKELALGDSHEGLLDLTSEDVKPGDSFAKKYGLDDTIIDIENKMFTHRPDLFGQIGVAREIAGIQHKQFTSPEWYINEPEFKDAEGLKLEVANEAPEQVPRFMAVAIKNIEVKPSPLWLQAELVRLGSKPINNIVDATNYIMLLTSQPTHAYDYDKLGGHKLISRLAKKGEAAKLLNGKTYEFDETDIVIADGEGVVGLAGIMGGGDSEVSAETKNIVLEVANFDMYTIRRSSMRHGLFTDALTRFNKGQSPLQNAVVLAKLMELIGGEQASAVFDAKSFKDEHDDKFKNKWTPETLTVDFINERLGTTISGDEIIKLLENVEFHSHDMAELEKICVTAPFWRTDIELPEDIIEEVGRLYGFDKLPRELPRRTTKPALKNTSRELAKTVREALARAGANEVLTYSFVHKNVIERAGQNYEKAYQIANALSPDLQYYRLSLTPSLLDKVHMNIKAGHNEFALFEINKVHYKGEMDVNEPEVPNEDNHVALTIAYGNKNKPTGSPFYQARNYLSEILKLDTVDLVVLADFDVPSDEWGQQLTAAYEPNRSAVIVKDKQIWGAVGEYKQAVKAAFKLPEFSAGFEVHQDILTLPQPSYKPLSKYPSTSRDISFKVTSDVTYGAITTLARKGLEDIEVDTVITPGDIYQAQGEPTKSVTISVTLTSHHKTLSSDEANAIVDKLATAVTQGVGAEVI